MAYAYPQAAASAPHKLAGGWLWVSRRARAALCRFLISHRFTLQGELVRGMHDAIKDRVGEGRVAELVVPALDRQLAGDHRRAAADTVVEELEQIAALGRRRRRQPPVVN